MSFITGLSFLLLLCLFSVIAFLLIKKLPKEFSSLVVLLLLAGDAILAGMYYYSLLDIVEDVKKFKLGIAGAFAIGSFVRVIYLLLTSEK